MSVQWWNNGDFKQNRRDVIRPTSKKQRLKNKAEDGLGVEDYSRQPQNSLFLFLSSVFIYLKARGERERQRGSLRCSTHWLTLQMFPTAVTGQAEARILNIDPDLACVWQAPNYLSCLLLPLKGHISRKWDLVVEPGLELGTQIWDEGVPSSVSPTEPNAFPSVPAPPQTIESTFSVVSCCWITWLDV